MKLSDVMDAIGKGVSDAVDYVADKNRTNAQLSRLKTVIRHETDTLNKSYIALGKYYYENMRSSTDGEKKRICDSIENSIKNINAARDKYERLAAKAKQGKTHNTAPSDIHNKTIDKEETVEEKSDCDLSEQENQSNTIESISETSLEPETKSTVDEFFTGDEEKQSSDGVQKERKTIKMILKKSEEQSTLVDNVNTDGEAAE